MTPRPTPIYHITDLSNLSAILDAGGLQCCNVMRGAGQSYTSIAYDSIQDRRSRTIVPCGPRGTLHDYVPFYFAPRSPMLYTIWRGNVPGASQSKVVYLVTTIERVMDGGLGFAFTYGHGIMRMSEFYDDIEHLGNVDRPLMNATMWKDTDDDPDRRRRRQAEFLVHSTCPWELIDEVVAINRHVRQEVETLIRDAGHSTVVRVNSDWYY